MQFTQCSNCEFYWWLSGSSQHGVGVGACVFNCLHVLNCVLRIGDRSVELSSSSFPLLYVRDTSVQKGQCYCLHELGSTTSRLSRLSSGRSALQARVTKKDQQLLHWPLRYPDLSHKLKPHCPMDNNKTPCRPPTQEPTISLLQGDNANHPVILILLLFLLNKPSLKA